MHASQALRVFARADEHPVAGQELLGAPRQPNRAAIEQDQVVADALEVGDQMRGEEHRQAGVRDLCHQHLEELPSRQRVEVCDRLIQHQQVWALAQRHRERDLRLLAAGELADPLPQRNVQIL